METSIKAVLQSFTVYPLKVIEVNNTTGYTVVLKTPKGLFTKDSTESGMFSMQKLKTSEIVDWIRNETALGSEHLINTWLRENK